MTSSSRLARSLTLPALPPVTTETRTRSRSCRSPLLRGSREPRITAEQSTQRPLRERRAVAAQVLGIHRVALRLTGFCFHRDLGAEHDGRAETCIEIAVSERLLQSREGGLPGAVRGRNVLDCQ